MLASCQKSHNWVVFLQVRIPVDDNRLVPPAILLPGHIVGVLGVVLKERTEQSQDACKSMNAPPCDIDKILTRRAWPFAASLMQYDCMM